MRKFLEGVYVLYVVRTDNGYLIATIGGGIAKGGLHMDTLTLGPM